jgi:hypothetical protein
MPINNRDDISMNMLTSFNDDLKRRVQMRVVDAAEPSALVRRHCSEANQSLGVLCSGAKFSGFQSSSSANDDSRYEVSVELQYVDLKNSHLCGYLNISNLTQEYPELTTFFEAEIIDGSRCSFLTRKWEADEDIDRSHWTKFPGFNPSMEMLLQDRSLEYEFPSSRYVFMRWKELFLVPDHHVDSINGASYEGFYYACADLENETIEGYYYHHTSPLFQRLELQYHRDRRHPSFEFR